MTDRDKLPKVATLNLRRHGRDREDAMNADDILTESIRRIAGQFAPRRIVLFGSRARGNANADSDFDLLVVVDGEPDCHQLAGQIRWALRDLPTSFDILVESSAHWQKWRQVRPALEHAIDRDGRVVLDAAA